MARVSPFSHKTQAVRIDHRHDGSMVPAVKVIARGNGPFDQHIHQERYPCAIIIINKDLFYSQPAAGRRSFTNSRQNVLRADDGEMDRGTAVRRERNCSGGFTAVHRPLVVVTPRT